MSFSYFSNRLEGDNHEDDDPEKEEAGVRVR